MSIQHLFLGWDRPILQLAVEQLYALPTLADEHVGGCVNWSNVTIVVSGKQAQRRLSELILLYQPTLENPWEALHSGKLPNRPILPANILTQGRLLEQLYDAPNLAGGRRVADDLECTLAWARAIEKLPNAMQILLFSNEQNIATFSQRFSAAKRFMQSHAELRAARMSFAAVDQWIQANPMEDHATSRWSVLANLEQAYHQVLADAKLVDQHQLRETALAQQAIKPMQAVVLLAMPELSPLAAEMLKASKSPLVVMTAAPETHRAGFNDLGQLVPAYWQKQLLEVDASQIHFVDEEQSQPAHLLQQLASDASDSHHAADITIGLGNDRIASAVRQTFELADIPIRYAAGTPIHRSRPYQFLRCLADYTADGVFDKLATLLRHPDVENELVAELAAPATSQTQTSDDRQARQAAIDDWLTFLDRYMIDHLQEQPTRDWLGNDIVRSRMKQLHQWVTDLCALAGQSHFHDRKPFAQWMDGILAMLRKIYGNASFTLDHADDAKAYDAVQVVVNQILSLEQLPADHALMPTLTLSQTISLLLDQLSQAGIADAGSHDAVEMVGFLELPLDDAPVVNLFNVNEGYIPTSRQIDPLLPDHLRNQLSLTCDETRYARDLLYLTMIVQTRKHCHLWSARRTSSGEPLHISRLLLTDTQTRVARIKAFYDAPSQATDQPLLLEPGYTHGHDAFLIPAPAAEPLPLEKLRVTAFRDYLQCPYRFYLQHVLGLKNAPTPLPEMDAAHFGTLAHNVLNAFGLDDCRTSGDEKRIFDFLKQTLHDQVKTQFGTQLNASVLIQVKQLEGRLEAFARWQAKAVHDGWRIMQVERKHKKTLTIDNEPFILTGRIDRIDRHEEHGYRIIDYKTGDKLHKPKETHQRSGEWIDLQLPLYLQLAENEIDPNATQLGYICLPMKRDDVQWYAAPWTPQEIDEATEKAKEIVRNIRAGVFWPPNPHPKFDAFEDLCAAQSIDVQQLIEASTPRDTGGKP